MNHNRVTLDIDTLIRSFATSIMHAEQRQPLRGTDNLLPSNPTTGEIAARYLKSRRERDIIFNRPGLFGDPAWDILIDLYVAKHVGTKVAVPAACIAASVPPTTALRHLNLLTDEHLVERYPDRNDSRRVWVAISDDAQVLLDRYFEAKFPATV